MQQFKIFKQMIEFQKNAFDNSFKALSTFQDNSEKLVDVMVNQSPWVPEEGRKAFVEWLESYKKGRDEFKNLVDDNYKKVEDFFEKAEK